MVLRIALNSPSPLSLLYLSIEREEAPAASGRTDAARSPNLPAPPLPQFRRRQSSLILATARLLRPPYSPPPAPTPPISSSPANKSRWGRERPREGWRRGRPREGRACRASSGPRTCSATPCFERHPRRAAPHSASLALSSGRPKAARRQVCSSPSGTPVSILRVPVYCYFLKEDDDSSMAGCSKPFSIAGPNGP